ncbi:TRAP transporter small permease [Blastococcus sp. CT_GayMR20]|uniref:TRAP transporter small permease n=1 Tax=Blastococcus sp. CT_GayMR20 TaxID=2559609 RepID=UPI00142F55DB|nr:TRAP transporter small permease [Blastococcus sp. CT_GayMR20]
MRRAYGVVAVSVEALTATLTLGLVVLVSTNVVARYVFSGGIAWAEEMSRLIFVWMSFLGAYVALRRGAHLAIGMLVDRLPQWPRFSIVLFGQALVAAFLVVLVKAAVELVQQSITFGTTTPILGISVAWSHLPIAVSGILMLLHVLGDMFVMVQAARAGDTHVLDTPDDDQLGVPR